MADKNSFDAWVERRILWLVKRSSGTIVAFGLLFCIIVFMYIFYGYLHSLRSAPPDQMSGMIDETFYCPHCHEKGSGGLNLVTMNTPNVVIDIAQIL